MTAPRGPRDAGGDGSDEPDEPDDHPPRGSQAPGEGDGPVSLLVATGWTAGTTLVFLSLLSVLVAVRPDADPDLISAFGCQAIAYLLGLFAILRVHAPNASIRDFLGARATRPAFYAIAVLMGLAFEAPVSALYDAIERRWPSPSSGDGELLKLIAAAPPATQIALCLVIVGLGPALEEIFFRGALARLLRRAGPALAIVGTAALFAVAHVQPQKFLPIGLFGVALGVLRYASGSLLPGIVLHATFNAIPLVAVLSAGAVAEGSTEGAPGLEGAPLPPWLVAGSAVIAAGLIGLAFVVGGRAQGAARDREKDRE